MSTLSCSLFLRRQCLTPYEGGNKAIAAHGPYVELFDMDGDPKHKGRHLEKKLRVFMKSRVRHLLPINDGHVVAISAETRDGRRIYSATVIHKEAILLAKPRYAVPSNHQLCDHPANEYDETCASAIPQSNEFVLLTGESIIHAKIHFKEAPLHFDIEILQDVVLKTIFPRHSSAGYSFAPMYVAPSADLEFLVIASDQNNANVCSTVYAKRTKKGWICKENKREFIPTIGVIISDMDIVAICGVHYTCFASINIRAGTAQLSQFKSVATSSNFHTNPRRIAVRGTGESRRLIIIADGGISVSSFHSPTEIVFLYFIGHFTSFMKDKTENTMDLAHRLANISKRISNRPATRTREERDHYSTMNSLVDNQCDPVVDATVIEHPNNARKLSELLVSYKSGQMVAYDISEKVPIDPCSGNVILFKFEGLSNSLFACWNKNVGEHGFSYLIGLSNTGQPLALKVNPKGGGLTNFIDPRDEQYTNVVSKTTTSGDLITISVFYNRQRFLVYEVKGVLLIESPCCQKQHSQGIRECFVSETFVAIVYDSEIHVKATQENMTKVFDLKDFDRDDQVTCFKTVLVDMKYLLFLFGTSKGNVLKWKGIFAKSHTKEFEEFAIKEERCAGNTQRILDIKMDAESGAWTAWTREEMPTGNNSGTNNKPNYSPGPGVMGFITVHAQNRNEQVELAVSVYQNFLCLIEMPHHNIVFMLPICHYIEGAPISAHFVGDAKDRNIKMYTTVMAPEGNHRLVHIEGTLTNVPRRFMLPSALCETHAEKTHVRDIHITSNMNEDAHHCASVVSTRSNIIELMKLNGRGTLKFLSIERMQGATADNLKITCSDVTYDRGTRQTYVLIGSDTGEICLRIFGPTNSFVDIVLTKEKSRIFAVRFIHDPSFDLSPYIFVVHTNIGLKVFDFSMNPCKGIIKGARLEHSVPLEMSVKEATASQLITTGDAESIHDIWLVSEKNVLLFPGRDEEFKKRSVELSWGTWAGAPLSSCLLSTRSGGAESTYLDLVFVSKKKGRLGVIAALHLESNPADVLQFAEWPQSNTSSTVALHAELIKRDSDNDLVANVTVRLFTLKKRSESIHILIGRLIVDETEFRVDKTETVHKIRLTISEPHHFVVRCMRTLSDVDDEHPPKYAVVTSQTGSEVIRICEKKERVPDGF